MKVAKAVLLKVLKGVAWTLLAMALVEGFLVGLHLSGAAQQIPWARRTLTTAATVTTRVEHAFARRKTPVKKTKPQGEEATSPAPPPAEQPPPTRLAARNQGTAKSELPADPGDDGSLPQPAPERQSAPQGLQRAARVFAAMAPEEVAAIADKMSDREVTELLGKMREREVAKILAAFKPERAAQITKEMTQTP